MILQTYINAIYYFKNEMNKIQLKIKRGFQAYDLQDYEKKPK